jgi:hypothetical protein
METCGSAPGFSSALSTGFREIASGQGNPEKGNDAGHCQHAAKSQACHSFPAFPSSMSVAQHFYGKIPVRRKILGVIPARYTSSRFPGKPLARIGSKSMLEHVFERTSQARYLTSVTIATDDERIADAARSFGAPVRMTRTDHLSGTDRVAEVASADTAELVVNIQGDEPLIDPAAIDAAILPLAPRRRYRHGYAEEAHRGSARDRRSQRGEGGHGPRRQRDLFFTVHHSLWWDRLQPVCAASPTTNTSACTFTAGNFCWDIPICR